MAALAPRSTMLLRTAAAPLAAQRLVQRAQTLLASSSFALPSSSAPATPAAAAAASSRGPSSLTGTLGEIMRGFLDHAVPKKKTSHSKKAMRSANKGLKEQTAITTCRGCGGAKRMHHICPNCWSDFRREVHQRARDGVEGETATTTPVPAS